MVFGCHPNSLLVRVDLFQHTKAFGRHQLVRHGFPVLHLTHPGLRHVDGIHGVHVPLDLVSRLIRSFGERPSGVERVGGECDLLRLRGDDVAFGKLVRGTVVQLRHVHLVVVLVLDHERFELDTQLLQRWFAWSHPTIVLDQNVYTCWVPANEHLSPQFSYEHLRGGEHFEEGHRVRAAVGNRIIGNLMWDHEGVGDVYVNPEYRRRGIATEMWNVANREATSRGIIKPKHSGLRTDEGDAWARSVGGHLPPRKDDDED